MMPKIPMQDDEINIHKPICADFVSFRAGIRCAERVYNAAALQGITDFGQMEELLAKKDAEIAELVKYKNEYCTSHAALQLVKSERDALAAKAIEHRDGRLAALEESAELRVEVARLTAALQNALYSMEEMTRHFGIKRLHESTLQDTEIRGRSHVAMKMAQAALEQPCSAIDAARGEG